MRRQAWWGGVIAAVALGCTDPIVVEPVTEQQPEEQPAEALADTPDIEHPAQTFVEPESHVHLKPHLPAVERFDAAPVEEAQVANPSSGHAASVPQFPSETATPVVKGSAGWKFMTSANGLPPRIFGVSADEGGNLWVAGGNAGLFVLRPGETRFRNFGTPYPAISVAGGKAGVAYVGYLGLNGCDMAWDTGGTADVYKSGDADRVWLSGESLSRAHYDIYSGPGVVAAEPQGREKLCNIFRIAYDGKTQSVWFGGNHGVAWGHPDNTQVVEHTHPAINAYIRKPDGTLHYTMMSGDYMGIAPDKNGDLWIGGRERSARFPYATNGNNFWTADTAIQSQKVDVWPDAVPQDPNPEQSVQDDTHGFAPMSNGTTWVGSSTKGLALLSANRKPVAFFSAPLMDKSITAMTADPANDSMWAGHGGVGGKGGLTRLVGTTWMHYGSGALGSWATSKVYDLQVQKNGPGGKRRVLVAFFNGAIGIYDGE